jgi:hypothetical protein
MLVHQIPRVAMREEPRGNTQAPSCANYPTEKLTHRSVGKQVFQIETVSAG